MIFRKQQILPVLSILLLSLFFGYYLYSAFDLERNKQKNEVIRIFNESIQEYENRIFKSLIKNAMSNKNASVSIKKSRLENNSKSNNSLKLKIDKPERKRNGFLTIEIKETKKGVSGLTEKIDLQSKGNLKDKLPEIEKAVKQNMIKNKVSGTVSLKIDSLENENLYLSTYTDIGTNQMVVLLYKTHFKDVFKNILPQLSSILLLLSLIVISYIYIERSNRKSQELLKLKNDFISSVTHELKTPIATMSVSLEALELFDINEPEKRTEYLTIARGQLTKLTTLVERILDFSNTESKKLVFEEINLSVFLGLIIKNQEARLQSSNMGISLNLPSTIISAFTVRYNLETIITNILDNAIKYNDAPKGEIMLVLKSEEYYAQIEIIDNGSIIPETENHKIFDKYYRIMDNHQTHIIKGHGLGLYIVKELAQQINTIVKYKADPKGNNFIIKIPIQ